MDRVQKLKINATASLINRFVVILSGLILPRLILSYYGSEVNGLISTINQYLSIITLLDLGVGSVVQSALFKPLAKKDEKQVSMVIKSALNFFKKIAYALVVYIIILVLIFPNLIESNISYIATGFLIISMSINLFAQYYFGIVNELLLNADQRAYIQLIPEIITVIINMVVTIILITSGYSIITVKLSTGLIFLARPILLKLYVEKNYNINYQIEITEEPIKQKWNGMAQHIASIVLNSTGVVVLSIFTSLETVSVYSIYNMVVTGVRMIIVSLVSGTHAFFGNLLANEEFESLNLYFSRMEWLLHTAVSYVFGMTAILITPFVMLYTSGVGDANYYVPVFAVTIVLAEAVKTLRLPYNTLVLAAGHYKQTQTSAIIEVILNIVISISVVYQFGLIGVALGTLIAMLYRTIYLAWYVSNNILGRNLNAFFKHIFVDALTLVIFILIGSLLNVQIVNIMEWVYFAIFLGIIYGLITLIVNLLFYKNTTRYYIKKIFRTIRVK